MRTTLTLMVVGVVAATQWSCNGDTVCVGSYDGGSIEIEWQHAGDDIAALPLVADVDGDGAPEVLVNAGHVDVPEQGVGAVVALDGATGAEKWRIEHDPANDRFGTNERSSLAIADVDGDERPDILYAGPSDPLFDVSAIHAVDGAGELLWTSRRMDGGVARVTVQNGAPTIANLDDDPMAEIVVGAAIFDHDGLLVWNEGGDGGRFGFPSYLDGGKVGEPIYRGALSTVVDLDGDGRPEIISGREAWTIAWVDGDPPSVSVDLLWRDESGEGNDGWPAVADLDGNGTPEVVLTAWPEIRVLDGRTGTLWCGADPSGAACLAVPALRTQPIAIEGGNLGGPATIADFDGDGRPEVAIAGGRAFAVYDFARPGEDLVTKDGRTPVPGAMFVRWAAGTWDQSSATTGSSAFDLDGDGTIEILYQDECHFRVFDGATGGVRFETINSNGTIHEYPVVVDVDRDGSAEILVVASRVVGDTRDDCERRAPDFVERRGLVVYGSGRGHPWAPARPFWTQHTQHVTDVDAAGNVPFDEEDHWRGVNGFRQAVPVDDGGTACR